MDHTQVFFRSHLCKQYTNRYRYVCINREMSISIPPPRHSGTGARLRQRSTWMNSSARKPPPPPPPRRKAVRERRNSPGSTWTSWRSTKRPGREDQRGERRRACGLCTRFLRTCTAEREGGMDDGSERLATCGGANAVEFFFNIGLIIARA